MDTTDETGGQVPKARRKPGPVAQGYARYNITVEPELGEWAKYQPGGMSETVRRLLAAEKARQEKAAAKGTG